MKLKWAERRGGVSPVIATILMVAITVVLAAVLYVMVTQFTQGGGGGEPVATFTSPRVTAIPDQWQTDIAGVSRNEVLSSYKVILLVNGTIDATIETLADGASDTSGSYSGITFSDIDGGGRLSGGDRFIVDTVHGMNYELNLYWKASGAKIGSQTWTG